MMFEPDMFCTRMKTAECSGYSCEHMAVLYTLWRVGSDGRHIVFEMWKLFQFKISPWKYSSKISQISPCIINPNAHMRKCYSCPTLTLVSWDCAWGRAGWLSDWQHKIVKRDKYYLYVEGVFTFFPFATTKKTTLIFFVVKGTVF